MIFIRLAFLILVLMSMSVYAQHQLQTSEQNNKAQACKFRVITGLNYSDCKTIEKFIQEGDDYRTHIMVLYGPNFDQIIRNLRKKCSAEFRGTYEGPKFRIISGEFRKKQFIELWIVPEGGEPPISKKAEKINFNV